MTQQKAYFPARGPIHLMVWDLPTRLFHWLLVVLVGCAYVAGRTGGNAMLWHTRCGFAILALILFRIMWGIFGSRSARFRSFLRGPHSVFNYTRKLFGTEPVDHLGHNPLGGWSIVAMLSTLLFQAASGLFADDGIITQGPLAHMVSNSTSSLLTDVHRLNQLLIALLVIVHVMAIFFYWGVKRINLILPMITGIKTWHGPPQPPQTGPAWPAAIAAAVAIGGVYLLVR